MRSVVVIPLRKMRRFAESRPWDWSHIVLSTSEVAVAVMDALSKQVTGTNVVVIANAPVHRSHEFQSRIDKCRERGLHLYFLPPYSPELNLIEIVWRQINQHWISLAACTSPEHLWNELGAVLRKVGTEYKLNYSWPDFIR